VPDLITFAKGVTSAYLPLGGVVVRRALMDQIWDSEVGLFNHGSTFGGHPVATAVAAVNIQAMHDEKVMEHVRSHEQYLRDGFAALVAAHGIVREWRGTGYFYALELMRDRETGEDLSEADAAGLQGGVLARILREEGLLVRPDDRGATMLTFSPPLVADRDVIDDLHARADRVLNRTAAWLNENR
jgi:adenosylmethionine-8-amino-7-oxononanoate aminotransferase